MKMTNGGQAELIFFLVPICSFSLPHLSICRVFSLLRMITWPSLPVKKFILQIFPNARFLFFNFSYSLLNLFYALTYWLVPLTYTGL